MNASIDPGQLRNHCADVLDATARVFEALLTQAGDTISGAVDSAMRGGARVGIECTTDRHGAPLVALVVVMPTGKRVVVSSVAGATHETVHNTSSSLQ